MAITNSYTRRKKKGGLSRVKSYVKKNKGKSIGIALGTGASIGALVVASKKGKLGASGKTIKTSGVKGSPTNPYVQRALIPTIPNKSSFQSRVKKTFTDPLTGKTRKKEQVMPGVKKNDVNAKYIQEPTGLKKTIAYEVDRPGVVYEKDSRVKPLNLGKVTKPGKRRNRNESNYNA